MIVFSHVVSLSGLLQFRGCRPIGCLGLITAFSPGNHSDYAHKPVSVTSHVRVEQNGGKLTLRRWILQELHPACRRNMRSSSLGNLESSALRACMEHGGSDRGAVDVSKGVGPTEGLARS